MKGRVALCAILIGFLAGVSYADGFVGRAIAVQTGNHVVKNPIISLPYNGPAVTGRYVAVAERTGKKYPVTVSEGAVIFVPKDGRPNTKRVYRIAEDKGDTSAPKVRLEKKASADAVEVFIHGKLFTTYHYSNANKKPFLWPVNAQGGVGMTRDFPMGPKVVSHDHPHHRSFWTAYGNVNGADCWGEEKGSGYQHSGEVTCGSGDAMGWLKAKNVWEDRDHKPVVDETREYRFYDCPPAQRVFDLTVTFTASHGDVTFGDTKEGGIVALRIRDDVREVAGKGGRITLSTGATTEAHCWGRRAAWCDYSGRIKGVGARGIAIFDNTTNLHFPARWHVRSYGLMAANPFATACFVKGAAPTPYTLKSGQSLTFHYRILVHSGNVKKARVAEWYENYATPPKAFWVK